MRATVTTEATTIDVYLEPYEVDTLESTGLLAIPDQVSDSVILIYNGERPGRQVREGAAAILNGDDLPRRVRSGRGPLTYSHAHESGAKINVFAEE